MNSWSHAGPAALAAFLASLVEFVEALTIVLAVGCTRGWAAALAGAGAGAVLLAALVLALGPALLRAPLHPLQFALGVLLLLFGLNWLRKAVLRAAGRKALHDEDRTFAEQTEVLRAAAPAERRFDAVGFVVSAKAVLVEGLEVVFVVIAVGAAGRLLAPAAAGAAAAGLLVATLGFVLHRPLSRVPENRLKFLVGIMLSSFGVFWIGEGLGFSWPGGDWAVAALAAAFCLASALARRALRGT